MWHDLLLVIWFAAPIGAANMAPIAAAKLPRLSQLEAPMDFGKHFRGVRILGDHKTWRGLVAGLLMATLVLWLEQLMARHLDWAQSLTAGLDYATLPVLVVGPLFALGTLGGDALKSFFKRQRRLPPGKPWIPFDQLDILCGALPVIPFITLSAAQYLWLVVVVLGGQFLVTYLAYLGGIKEKPF